ncbi:DUF3152 domain-containing protein [Trujillonella endophytica]|uniref:DUF3152 domain-containing protein n=1 Tax=Trujillonella endophytica TaxID=673521 RepID=UPI000B88EB93|nr:DUF3152 domain-containing protein [Trujillella endophytica]
MRRPPPSRVSSPARPVAARSRPPADGRLLVDRPAGTAARPVAAGPSRPSPFEPRRRSSPPPGRLRRFVLRHGWRAYAIPLLTIATLLTLVDLARQDTPSEAATSGPAVTAPVSAGEAAVGEGVPADADPAEGEAPPAEAPAESPPAPGPGYVEQGAGTVTVVPGSSAVYGSGPLHRFAVEIEDGIGVDGAAFAAAVEATLADPRGWGAGGRMSFQRVGVEEAAAGEFDFKVSLISPGSMETYCPGVGTGGYTSCRYGERAVINLARWETAVPDYEGDVATYRLYVVNHEVGHALGNGHQECPGPGRLAPVMQQQTLGLEGCARNPWPFP